MRAARSDGSAAYVRARRRPRPRRRAPSPRGGRRPRPSARARAGARAPARRAAVAAGSISVLVHGAERLLARGAVAAGGVGVADERLAVRTAAGHQREREQEDASPHLRRGTRSGMTDVLETWAVQDSPPGAAITALVARGDVEVGWLDRAIYEERTVVALYNARSATAIVPAGDVAAYATAQLPADDIRVQPAREERPRRLRGRARARHRGDQRRARRARAEPRRPARGAAQAAPGRRCCRGATAARATTRGAGC